MLETITNLDANILLFIQDYVRTPWLTPLMKFLSLIGELGAVRIVLTIILLIRKNTRRAGLVVLISMAVTFVLVSFMIKPAVHRVRPFNLYPAIQVLGVVPSDYSFPSGHTSNGFAAALVMLRMLPRRAGVPAVILAALIAFSRLYVGAHYPTDVIAGLLIALVISQLVWYIMAGRQRRRTQACAG